MTNEQLYIAIGIPMLFNAALIGLVVTLVSAKFGGVANQFAEIDRRFQQMDKRFDQIDRRFDDMRDLWRAELRRVEEVLDARLKHIEERG